ncbi:Sulfite exporter TauE/SafE [Ferrimonas sediminum]|uniref:Probable membrane transporter protein n=1 Tax=Ferrimonas sediminum TaxID=718193 RepID=A0A1G8WF73_9GAMM|nr:sulfite exporter TauE/SafE family protein [Ferrimonas sediminum]SDJ76833.1 Sulfite exporter TauE/SafE [Ferrimonas sediminum]
MLAFALQVVFVAGGLIYCWMLFHAFSKQRRDGQLVPSTSVAKVGAVGALANFLDTLGVGSFAIKTAFYKQFKLVDDRLLPGTLNGQCVLPTVAQALLFIGAVDVDPVTLIGMMAAAALGACIGAKWVSGLDRQLVRLIMCIALLIVAALIFAGLLGWFPVGGDAMGLGGTKLAIALAGNFIFGALMSVGVGLYAPCMTLVYLLGMNPIAAFPIMMGSCAVLSFFSAGTFIRNGAFDAKAVLAVAIAGPVAVVLAATLVKSMDVEMLKWLVAFVVLYTSASMYRSWQQSRPPAAAHASQ